MLLTPTLALIAGVIISLAAPEHLVAPDDVMTASTVQAALPAGYLLYGDLEQQP